MTMGSKMKVITIHSFKGGTGKTNIIANLAYALAKSGYRVGVIDSDLTHPSLHVIFGLGDEQPYPTLTEFVLDKCKPDKIVHDITARYDLKGKLFLVPSNLNDEAITEAVNKGYEIGRIFRGLREIWNTNKLDYILIDTKPGLDEKTMLFFTITDAVLVVSRNDDADFRGTVELLKIIVNFRMPFKYIVTNMIDDPSKGEFVNRLKKMYKDQDIIISSPILYSKKLCMGHSPCIDDLFAHKYPDDPFTKSIFKLKDELVRKFEK